MNNENLNQTLGLTPKIDNSYKENTNSYANALKTIGWIVLIVGVIGSFSIGSIPKYPGDSSMSDYTIFSWRIALPYILASIVSGVGIMGFSEIINLLHKINQKLK